MNHWPAFTVCPAKHYSSRRPVPAPAQADAGIGGPSRPSRAVTVDSRSCGLLPGVIRRSSRPPTATASRTSPTFQVYYVDSKHVALSCQFFNKTRRNVEENPYAAVMIEIRGPSSPPPAAGFDHAETGGPLFDTMAVRIQVIASHSGMKGIFRLISADVYEVRVGKGWRTPAASRPGARPGAGGRAAGRPAQRTAGPADDLGADRPRRDLDALLDSALPGLDELFGSATRWCSFPTTASAAAAIASRATVRKGSAPNRDRRRRHGHRAAERRMVRVAGVGAEIRYGHAVRERFAEMGGADGSSRRSLSPDCPMPGRSSRCRCSPATTGGRARGREPRSAGVRRVGRGVPADRRQPDRHGHRPHAGGRRGGGACRHAAPGSRAAGGVPPQAPLSSTSATTTRSSSATSTWCAMFRRRSSGRS